MVAAVLLKLWHALLLDICLTLAFPSSTAEGWILCASIFCVVSCLVY